MNTPVIVRDRLTNEAVGVLVPVFTGWRWRLLTGLSSDRSYNTRREALDAMLAHPDSPYRKDDE